MKADALWDSKARARRNRREIMVEFGVRTAMVNYDFMVVSSRQLLLHACSLRDR